MNIDQINAKLAELNQQADQLKQASEVFDAKIEEMNKEFARVQKLVDYYDKVDDFSRAAHDLDVAEAARNAFSRYCEEKYEIECKIDAVSEEASQIEDKQMSLDNEIVDLEDQLEALEEAAA